jgi:hypothetical protein
MEFKSTIVEDYTLAYKKEDGKQFIIFYKGDEELSEILIDPSLTLSKIKPGTPQIRDNLKVLLAETIFPKYGNDFKIGFPAALNDLKHQYNEYLKQVDEVNRLASQGNDQEAIAKQIEEAGKFEDFLLENNMTVFDFIRWCSIWTLADEEHNFTMGLLAAISTLAGIKPLWFMPIGPSSKGKTFLLESIFSMLPDNFIIDGCMTEAVIYRLSEEYGQDYFDKKWIDFGDLGGDTSIDKWAESFDIFKKMSTEGFAKKTVVGDNINPETGRRELLPLMLTGKPGVVFTTVHQGNNKEQYQNRGFEVIPSSSDRDVEEYEQYYEEGSLLMDYVEDVVNPAKELFKSWIQQQVDSFKGLGFINPYKKSLAKWVRGSKNQRRELKTFKLMVGIVARLNKDSRVILTDYKGREFVIATKEDNRVVTKLFEPSSNLSPLAIDIFNKLVVKVGEFDQDEYEKYMDKAITLRQAKTFFTKGSLKHAQLRPESKETKDKFDEIFMSLKDEGYVDFVEEDSFSGSSRIYKLVVNDPIEHKDIEFTEEDIKRGISKYLINKWGYGIEPAELIDAIRNEPDMVEFNFGNLELPPWFTKEPEDSSIDDYELFSDEEEVASVYDEYPGFDNM